MKIRPAAVAGMFYPDDASELSQFINHALRVAAHSDGAEYGRPKPLIVPHAGYTYSGLTAAFAYACIQSAVIKRVVLFGPAHRVPFYGIALPDCDAFETPLGQVKLEQTVMYDALEFPQVSLNAQAHAEEHSLEVQLPLPEHISVEKVTESEAKKF